MINNFIDSHGEGMHSTAKNKVSLKVKKKLKEAHRQFIHQVFMIRKLTIQTLTIKKFREIFELLEIEYCT